MNRPAALAALTLTAAGSLLACAPGADTHVAPAVCATNPTTGHVFGVITNPVCGFGAIYVDVACGPLLLTHAEDDGCVRAHVVGDGSSTGVRGMVIVPAWYLVPGDTNLGPVN